MSAATNFLLPAGYVLTLTADSSSSGSYFTLITLSGPRSNITSLPSNTSVTIGPFNIPTCYGYVSDTGSIHKNMVLFLPTNAPAISTVTGNILIGSNDIYIVNNNSTRVILTLPAICNVGDYVRIIGKGTAGWRIAQPSGLFITYGDVATTVGTSGYLESNDRDCAEIICVANNSEYQVVSSQGNITYN